MSKSSSNTKIYFSIREVAQRFGVQQSLLRFWEKEFNIIRPKKSLKGTRLYTKEDIETIAMVYHLLKTKKLTIEGAKQELKKRKDAYELRIEAIGHLENIKKELLGLIDEM